MKLIEAKNISFSYGKKKVFENLSFSLPENSILCLLGPNGSGKTTLLRLLAGLYEPQEGVYLFSGENFSLLPLGKKAEKVAFVPGEISTPFDFSAEETALMGRFRFKKWWQDYNPRDEEEALAAMRVLGVDNIGFKSVNEISSGEKQLVFLAQALAQTAKLLILDEPSSHLDIKHKLKLLEIIYQMKRKGFSCVYASHDIKASLNYSDYCLCLKEGSFFYFGPSKEISLELLAKLYDLKDKDELMKFV